MWETIIRSMSPSQTDELFRFAEIIMQGDDRTIALEKARRMVRSKYRISDIAKEIHVCERTVYRWKKRGLL